METYSTITEGQGEAVSKTFVDGHGRPRLSVSDLPNAPVGIYSAVITEYDILGRVKRQTTPTEVNSSFQPVGDDAPNMPGRSSDGWLWTSQEYDWKGRVIKSINTDGTFKTISYTGCGCAGGEVVTTQGEQLTEGRRTQKVYSDPFGRVYKTQVLNWDNSVYSTAITNYNALNQTESIKTYQGNETADGSCPTGTCHLTSFVYDGHGRLKKRHVPEQDADKFTEWSYRADDKVLTETDARGAIANYSYNNRAMITGISYSSPNQTSIPVTPTVNYIYDAVGNKTQMTDGLGYVTYNYDQLSRITSETRQFNDITSRTFTLSYTYNMGGKLTSITDPYGSQISYSFDRTGRTTNVSATNVPGVLQMPASNIQYRAFNGMKGLTFGNGRNLSINYNSRQLISRYDVSGVMGFEYEHYADGKLKYATDLSGYQYDRKFTYDHAGRLSTALSGEEARGYPPLFSSPYYLSFQYDVWGNTTQRTMRHWSQPASTESFGYTNNRLNVYGNMTFDAEGNITLLPIPENDSILQQTYDTSNRITTTTSTSTRFGRFPNGRTVTQAFDGNGQLVKGNNSYNIRSTVFGGKEIVVSDQSGQRIKGNIYLMGEKIMEYGGYEPTWHHPDPYGIRERVSRADGVGTKWIELDPLGNSVGAENPYPDPLNSEFTAHFMYKGDPTDFSGGCTLDGVETQCSLVLGMLNNGSADFVSQKQTKKEKRVSEKLLKRKDKSDWNDKRFYHGLSFRSHDRRGGTEDNPADHEIRDIGELGKVDVYPEEEGELSEEEAEKQRVWNVDVVAETELIDDDGILGTAGAGSNDCLTFAQIVDQIAKNTYTDSSFVAELHRRFLSRSKEHPYSEFRSTGFKEQFRDEQGPGNSPNQVYHYIGVFRAGYLAGFASLAAPDSQKNKFLNKALKVANDHEDYDNKGNKTPDTPSHRADKRLNGVAVPQGFALGRGEIRRKDLGNRIRKEVCN